MQTSSFSQLCHQITPYQYFVIDHRVHELYFKDLPWIKDKTIYILDNPEQNKNLNSFEKISSFFIESNIKRSDTLICIGGGATTDLGGFVASTLFRGIKWIAIPTTLLSMIDAAIGGKVGINTVHGKNLIGQFHLPEKEIISTDYLKTLDEADYKSGLGEMIKYLFLDEKIYELMMKYINSPNLAHQLIPLCVTLKKQIVETDYKENGLREILNFGHTFGHGIEKTLKIQHGTAVALGIKLNLLLFTPHLLPFFCGLTKSLDLQLPDQLDIPLVSFLDFLEKDKKNKTKGEIRFVILDDIAQIKKVDLKIERLKDLLIKCKAYKQYFK